MKKVSSRKRKLRMSTKGRLNALGCVIKSEKNCRILNKAAGNVDDVYQIIGDTIKGVKLADILSDVKAGNTGWKHPCFENIAKNIKERDDFIVTPFEVAEGVLICKCGSNRTFSYQKQVRSADEPMSTFAQCVKCKRSWVYSG